MKKKRKVSLDDVLFWWAIIILLLWAIIKSFFIHSAPWQVYLPPAVVLILFAFSFWEKIGKYGEQLDSIKKDIKEIKEIDKRLIKIETEHNLVMKGKTKIKH